MRREDINIRDPYVLVHDGKYYLYGTRSATCWGEADGFDCYVSKDLQEFDGPIEIFHRPEGFFADRNYWAPECYYHDGRFLLVTTLGAEDRNTGIYILAAEQPEGPYEFYADCLTPADWRCLDGTLYWEEGVPYLVYSHSFGNALHGDFCKVRLTDDLRHTADEPVVLFQAKDTKWAQPVPFAKEEFGIEEDCYFSDGPSLMKMEDGRLYMLLSSWSRAGYAVGVAVSDTGSIHGPWRQQEEPLFPENGGHGMLFRNLQGEVLFTLHAPNDKFMERPIFWRVSLEDGMLKLSSPEI